MENQQHPNKDNDENSKESNDVTLEYITSNSNDSSNISDIIKVNPINKNFNGENKAKPTDLAHVERPHIAQNPNQRISQNRTQRKTAKASVKY